MKISAKAASTAGGFIKKYANPAMFKERTKKRRRARVVKLFAMAFVGWVLMSTMLVSRGCSLVEEYFDY